MKKEGRAIDLALVNCFLFLCSDYPSCGSSCQDAVGCNCPFNSSRITQKVLPIEFSCTCAPRYNDTFCTTCMNPSSASFHISPVSFSSFLDWDYCNNTCSPTKNNFCADRGAGAQCYCNSGFSYSNGSEVRRYYQKKYWNKTR